MRGQTWQGNLIIWDSCQSNIDVNSRFIFIFITAKVITNLVRAIDICKSSAVENLSGQILKDSFEILTLKLTQLYNECLTQGKFPEDWGLGYVSYLRYM